MQQRLDVRTPRGRVTVAQAAVAAERFEGRYKTVRLVELGDDACRFDRKVLTRKDGALVALAEIKCRTFTYPDFVSKYGSEWLISKHKVEQNKRRCVYFKVPFIGLLYLVPDDLLLVQKIFDERGQDATPMRYEMRETQANVNGGKKKEMVALVIVADRPKPPPLPAVTSNAAWIAEYAEAQARYALPG